MSKLYTQGQEILAFQIISRELLFKNKTRTLSFKLNDYDASIPIYQIVLEFIMETGGVF